MRWLVLALLATGCAKKGSSSHYGSPASYAEYDSAPSAEESVRYKQDAPRRSGAAPMAPPPPPPPPQAPMMMDDMSYEQESYYEEEPAPEPDEPAADRMVHYDGFAQLRTPRAEELVDGVIALAESVKGEVESRSLERVTVRVPVASFDGVWASILDMGPVVQRSLGAEDVTDAFADMGLRLKSLQATRDRLVVLLARTAEPEEKMQLLAQIHRLTEQIEVMDAQLATLADLAAMSRITVQAIAPDLRAGATSALPYGMGWIDGLSAFNHSMADAGKPVKLAVPEGFVRLDPKQFHVQAADGPTVWAGTLLNDPAGSGLFWRQAVVDRIGEQLEDGTTSTVGGWELVRFTEPGAKEPYVWHLGFRVDGKHLQVVQVTYPTAEQEQRYHSAVLAILKGGEA